MTRLRPLALCCLSLAALSLAGCDHARTGKATGAANNGKTNAKVATAIASAARDAADDGLTQESLMFRQRLYNADPRNEDNIINYARGLRRVGRLDDAILVVRTPANAARATAPLLTECAMVLISAGEYDEALGFAQKALGKAPKSPDAHHALALALSGLGENADAQLQFQKALDLWPENKDKTAIINNLAMSLTAQGKIAEARTVMSLATGEALRSRTYQNNRALLDSLKDREIRAEKITVAKPGAPATARPATGGRHMAPIIE